LHRTEAASTERPAAPEGGRSRRTFLTRSAAVAAVSGVVLASARDGQARGPAFSFRRLPDLYPHWNRRNLLEILQDEEEHIGVLTGLLDDKPPRARPSRTWKRTRRSTSSGRPQ